MTLTIPDTEWWGHSPTHGWVILDRRVANNRPGGALLTFLKCKDWTSFEESKDCWTEPHYVWVNQYLNKLSPDARQAMEAELQSLVEQSKQAKEDLYAEAIHALHKQFLERAGLPPSQTRRATKIRASYCWRCHKKVDNTVDLECVRCAWIVCGNCGTCGCAATQQAVEDFIGPSRSPSTDMAGTSEPSRLFSSFKDASDYARANPGEKMTRTENGIDWKVE